MFKYLTNLIFVLFGAIAFSNVLAQQTVPDDVAIPKAAKFNSVYGTQVPPEVFKHLSICHEMQFLSPERRHITNNMIICKSETATSPRFYYQLSYYNFDAINYSDYVGRMAGTAQQIKFGTSTTKRKGCTEGILKTIGNCYYNNKELGGTDEGDFSNQIFKTSLYPKTNFVIMVAGLSGVTKEEVAEELKRLTR